jgi:hypothetical protein
LITRKEGKLIIREFYKDFPQIKLGLKPGMKLSKVMFLLTLKMMLTVEKGQKTRKYS